MRAGIKALFTLAAVALAMQAQTAAAEGKLFLYNWTNYFSPALMEKFQKETGVDVTMDNFASEEEMLAKLQAGGSGYDIVFPGPSTIEVMVAEGLAAKIDTNAMPNFKNVMTPFDSVTEDPKREYSAPYMWGTTGFTYDSAKVPGGKLEDSWKEVFEPRAELQGNLAMLDDMQGVYNAAAYYLGVDKCTEDAAEAQKILDLLLAQKPYVKVYSNDGTIDRTVAGEVALHMQWNGASHRVKAELPTAVYVYPREGTGFWYDSMVVPANAPNMENAKTFINWMMDPANAAEATNYTGYMNAIRGSGDLLEASISADPAINMPEAYAERLRGYKPCSEKAVELRDRVWTRLKS